MIESKYHYEKVWRVTSDKELLRMIEQELPEAPLQETLTYIKQSCEAGKTVRFLEVAFRQKPSKA